MSVPIDTIVARSTPPGRGAVAVVRISGPEALEVLERVLLGGVGAWEARKARLGRIVHPEDGRIVDRALVSVFPAPDSYTGEDVVEISGHGGWVAPGLVLDACLTAGAREAEPGEFTRRGYLNGKLDLVQAEAILDLVEGRSQALHRVAVGQLERGLSQRISGLREGVVALEALLVHHIDFPGEDDGPTPVETIGREAAAVLEAMEALLANAPEGELLREGALTVLAGRPNSGKSSLFNALVGEERAIVTEVPGTTRDALEAVVSMGGFPFRLVDTAGLREDGERVERLGMEVAWRYLRKADLVLLCLPTTEEWGPGESAFVAEAVEAPVVVLRTKADQEGNGGTDGEEIRVSVWTGEGLAVLRRRLPEMVFRGLVEGRTEEPVVTRRRQSRALREARGEVEAFVGALEEGVPAEVASAHLKAAESHLEGIVGAVSTEDVLDRVFREFCIGK